MTNFVYLLSWQCHFWLLTSIPTNTPLIVRYTHTSVSPQLHLRKDLVRMLAVARETLTCERSPVAAARTETLLQNQQ